MDIDQIDSTFNDICNKKLSGALSPDTRNRFYQLVNIDLFKLKAGLPEDYIPGQALTAQGHQQTFKISDDVRFLIKETDIMRVNGWFPYPADYAAYDNVLFGYVDNSCEETKLEWKPVESVTGSERAYRLSSHHLPPTMERPILSYNLNGWRVDPQGINQIRLTYLRKPPVPLWNYTMSGNQEIFARTGGTGYPGQPSVDVIWPDPMFGDFVIRVCRYAGINLREDELVQFSQVRQFKGH